MVTGSYWLHAGLLMTSSDRDLLADGWAGPLVAMTAFWGLSLVAHTIRSIYLRGYDDVQIG